MPATTERAEEMIYLVGGPHDGTTLGWRGRDVVEMVERPGPVLALVDPSAIPVEPKRLFYRRSMGDPRLFVFQP